MQINHPDFFLNWVICYVIIYGEGKESQICSLRRWYLNEQLLISLNTDFFIFVSLIFALAIPESTELSFGTLVWVFKALSFYLFQQTFSINLQHLASKKLLELLFKRWTKQNLSLLCLGKIFSHLWILSIFLFEICVIILQWPLVCSLSPSLWRLLHLSSFKTFDLR